MEHCICHQKVQFTAVLIFVVDDSESALADLKKCFDDCYVMRMKPPWRACSKSVRYSVERGTGGLIVKRPLLCCDVLP